MPTTTAPSPPALSTIWRAGAWIALRTMSTPVFWSGLATFTRVERRDGAQQRHAAAGRNAFLDRRAGGVEGVVDAVLLFLDLDFGRAADADHRDAARELGQTLLQLLAIIVRGGLLDLRLDLGDARLDVLLVAGAVDDRGVLLVDAHALGAAEHGRASRSRA